MMLREVVERSGRDTSAGIEKMTNELMGASDSSRKLMKGIAGKFDFKNLP